MKRAYNLTTLFIFLFFVLTVFLFSEQTSAQQMIITVPSSDVLPSGQVILKTSAKSQFTNSDYTKLTPTATIGIGHGMDFSFGVPTKIDKDYNTSTYGNIGLKKVWFVGNSTRFTAGGNISPSFNMPVTPDMYTYAHFSQKIKKTRTSITMGAY